MNYKVGDLVLVESAVGHYTEPFEVVDIRYYWEGWSALVKPVSGKKMEKLRGPNWYNGYRHDPFLGGCFVVPFSYIVKKLSPLEGLAYIEYWEDKPWRKQP